MIQKKQTSIRFVYSIPLTNHCPLQVVPVRISTPFRLRLDIVHPTALMDG